MTITLLNNFKMVSRGASSIEYDVSREKSSDYYAVKVNGSRVGLYTKEYITQKVEDGNWSIIAPIVANGVDGKGKPLNFTDSMLKPFQRVVTKGSGTYICAIQKEGDPIVLINTKNTTEVDWLGSTYINDKNTEEHFRAVAIYDIPSMCAYRLNSDELGELVWKYVPPETERQKKIRELSESIESDLEFLAALKKEEEDV
jgi:hypothetical protein